MTLNRIRMIGFHKNYQSNDMYGSSGVVSRIFYVEKTTIDMIQFAISVSGAKKTIISQNNLKNS